jgi:putative ABC transport system permease protein
MFDALLQDVRYAARSLRRTPGFSIAAVVTLALGIGGNTAAFSVVDHLLLRPLPYPRGDELVMVYESFTADVFPGFADARRAGDRNVVSPANWLDWQRENRTLRGLAAWRSTPMTLTSAGEGARVNAQLVSSEFFPLLGVSPILGHTLTDEDDRPNAPVKAVLSYQFWQARFAGAPGVIGRGVELNGRPAEIVGVMPSNFRFIYPDNDVWIAYRLNRSERFRETSGRFVNVVARLRPGTTLEAAQVDMQAVAKRLAATYAFNTNTGVTLVPLREELTGHVSRSLLVLYAAIGILLLIACLNVTGLVLARAAARQRELVVRIALGAGRGAIIRSIVIESLLLGAAAGAIAVALAEGRLEALLAFAPADLLRVPALTIDRGILMYAFGVSVLTGVIVGLVPATLVVRRSAISSLRSAGFHMTRAPRLRQVLVLCQVAMTVVLLGGAALLLRTFVTLNRADAGFDRADMLTMEIALPIARYPPDRRTAFYREAISALEALPGAESVAAADSLAVIGSPRGGTVFHRLGTRALPLNEMPAAVIRVVAPGYFRALRIPVLRGREFTELDDSNPRPGFLVNEAFAKAFLSGIDPLRTSMSVWMQAENPYLPVIGVVGDVNEGSMRGRAQPTIFYSDRQMPQTQMTLFIRAAEPEALAQPAIAAIHRLDPNVAVAKVRTFENAIAESLARERLTALVSASFALIGLMLASLGVYGLLSFIVVDRTKEMGIRIALGAYPARLTRSVVAGGLRLVAIGIAIGFGGSLLSLRLLRSLLFGVTPYDSATFALTLLILCVVTSFACWMPARRAGRVEPLMALRAE